MPNNLSEIDTIRMNIKRVNTMKYIAMIFDENWDGTTILVIYVSLWLNISEYLII